MVSRLLTAEADTRIEHADTYWADILGQLYGFPRPPRWPQAAWTKGVRQVAFGRRETFEGLLLTLEAIFSMWDGALTVTNVTVDLSDSLLIADAPGTFNCAWENRWVRIVGGGRVLVTNVNVAGDELTVAKWNGLGHQKFSEAVTEATVDIRVLPFWVKEDPVRPEVLILLDEEVLGFVGSYLFPAGARDPSLDGIGGILVPDSTISGDGIPAIYLAGQEVAKPLGYALSLILPAGVKIRIRTTTWCPGESIGVSPLP